MHHSRAPAALIDDRLNAERYAREQIENLANLRLIGAERLGALLDDARSNYGILPGSEEYVEPEDGVGLLRGGDLEHGHLVDPSVWAPRSYLTPRGRLSTGDVLILAKGACIDGPAGVALVTSRHDGMIFNGTSYRVRLRMGDPGFLVAACMTSAFLLQKRREISNTGVSYNSEEAIKGFLVPNPSGAAQRYIGSKVRQAEVLREWEAGLTRLCFEMVTGLFPGVKESDGLTRQPSRTLPHQLVDRLNAEAYAVDYLSDDEVLARTGLKQRPLGDLVTAPINNSIRGVTEALGQLNGEIPMFRPADISGLWASAASAPNLPRAFEAEHAKSRVLPGDIVLSIAGTIGTAGRVPPSIEFGNINGSSARLRVHEAFRGYLLVLLNTPLGRRLTTRWAVGAVQKHLNLEDLPGILIPLAAEPVLRTLNEHVSQAERAYLGRRQLITAARLLVEALIERKVTEAELIAASKEPAADRLLLSRLAEDGLDGSGRPLFSDLDALQALLAEAKPQDPQ
jgi:type I restriction enzyme S subunit